MLAKILAGVVAAVAVAGVGVYYATDSGCGHKCSGTNPAPAVTTDGDCCAKPCSADQPTDDSTCCAAKASSCCAAKATNSDDLGACVGGMALTTAAPAKATKSAHCCAE